MTHKPTSELRFLVYMLEGHKVARIKLRRHISKICLSRLIFLICSMGIEKCTTRASRVRGAIVELHVDDATSQKEQKDTSRISLSMHPPYHFCKGRRLQQ